MPRNDGLLFSFSEKLRLIVQVLWGCHAFNATPEEAARTVVADLYELLSRGGSVSVHIEDADGSERTLQVSAG
jgi:hypothetical protein